MNENELNITRAATELFMRYGFSKTTIGDIASQAGVARQTVYNAFPGKDEILRAAIQLTAEENLRVVRAAWETPNSFEEKLVIFLELVPINWYEMISKAPDWAELLDGVHAAAAQVLNDAEQFWKSALKEMLTTEGAHSSTSSLPLDEIVEFFYSSSVNAKYGVRDIDHLKQRLTTIKIATLALL